MAVFGGAFTGTPNVGFGLSDAARDYRLGWRLTPAASGAPGFEVNLDATRHEAANDDAEHGAMLRTTVRWYERVRGILKRDRGIRCRFRCCR